LRADFNAKTFAIARPQQFTSRIAYRLMTAAGHAETVCVRILYGRAAVSIRDPAYFKSLSETS
jgi:hypothetical protein